MDPVYGIQISLSGDDEAPPHYPRNTRQPLVRLRRSYGSLNLMLTSGARSSDYVMHVIVLLFEYIALGVFEV